MRRQTQEALMLLEQRLVDSAHTLAESHQLLQTAGSLILIDEVFLISEKLKKQPRKDQLDVLVILAQYKPLRQLIRTASDLLPKVNQLPEALALAVNDEMTALLRLDQVFEEFEKLAGEAIQELRVKELVLRNANKRYAKEAQKLAENKAA
jgi:hypothetical protein